MNPPPASRPSRLHGEKLGRVTYTPVVAFEAIAYGADANLLLVIDESAQSPALLAYDAQTEGPKWQLAFDEPLLSVLFAHPQALPSSGAGSPWREAAPTHVAIVVDAAGSLHAVDLHLGKKLGSVGPFGKPRAVASCMTSGALAMAVLDKVLLWRSGHVVETAISRATALAFSADGKTLAVGTEAGDVIMLSLYGGAAAAAPENVQPAAPADTLARSFEAHGVGAVADLAQHPNGEWLSAGAYGVFAITEKGAQRQEKIAAGALRARFDATGARLAVQRAERAIAVYAWPALSVVARVEYTDRPVRGISFGPGDWLGVALDHGDGNKIDVVTSETHRTDTAPGRTHRSWTLYVEGQSKLLSAKEAEDIRRMKSPFTPDAPRKGNGGRIGIGAGISLAVLALRVCVHASGPSYSSSYSSPYTLPTATPTCDRACASERLAEVEKDCTENAALACSDDAAAARKALIAGRCPDLTSALKRMSGAETRASGSSTPLFGVHRLLAEFGVDEACKAGKIRPLPAVSHAQIVRFGKNGKERTIEAIPEATGSRDRGESPRALLTTSDGVVLAATLSAETPQRAVVYKRASDGAWPVSFVTPVTSGSVALVAKSASDVYLVSGTKLAHFDGTSWSDIALPPETFAESAAMAGGDLLFASNEAVDGSAIYRRHAGAWTKETTPTGLSALALYGGGASVWAVAEDADSNKVLLRRAANGAWSAKTPTVAHGSLGLRWVWSNPSGETFIGAAGGVLRTKDGGVTWTEAPHPGSVVSLWGRSSTDMWAIAGRDTVAHYDGKTWSNVDEDVDGAEYIGGTATDVLVLRAAVLSDPP